ncbi:hypothetical protein T484DRAFT_1836380 [Baffinella frigidus]|nr:hypothetical protein T484DRAFT_1836380 [Cryptophyta sp. CCMP2293]
MESQEQGGSLATNPRERRRKQDSAEGKRQLSWQKVELDNFFAGGSRTLGGLSESRPASQQDATRGSNEPNRPVVGRSSSSVDPEQPIPSSPARGGWPGPMDTPTAHTLPGMDHFPPRPTTSDSIFGGPHSRLGTAAGSRAGTPGTVGTSIGHFHAQSFPYPEDCPGNGMEFLVGKEGGYRPGGESRQCMG